MAKPLLALSSYQPHLIPAVHFATVNYQSPSQSVGYCLQILKRPTALFCDISGEFWSCIQCALCRSYQGLIQAIKYNPISREMWWDLYSSLKFNYNSIDHDCIYLQRVSLLSRLAGSRWMIGIINRKISAGRMYI